MNIYNIGMLLNGISIINVLLIVYMSDNDFPTVNLKAIHSDMTMNIFYVVILLLTMIKDHQNVKISTFHAYSPSYIVHYF